MEEDCLMATNDFIGFASSGSANIMSQADFAASAERTKGVQPGPASSKLANKIWRQGANMASALGGLIADQGYNALDNGDIVTLKTALKSSLLPETGTWTPTLLGNTTTGALVVTTANGDYVKIGRLVFVDCQLAVRAKPSYEDYPAGIVLVGGLPYNAASTADNFVCNGYGGIDDCCRSLIMAYIQSGNRIILGKLTNNQRQNAIFSSSVATGANIQLSTVDNTTLKISGCYRAQ